MHLIKVFTFKLNMCEVNAIKVRIYVKIYETIPDKDLK